ncbi:Os01g0584800, partial [Oryza sativa Japonica Group]
EQKAVREAYRGRGPGAPCQEEAAHRCQAPGAQETEDNDHENGEVVEVILVSCAM